MIKYYLYFLLGLITVFGQIQSICAKSANVIVKCDPYRNEIWKERRGKCGKCRPCEAKKGIYLNSIPVNFPKGPHGFTKCLKCDYCPDNFYARNRICQPCSVDKCAKLNRHTHTECSLDDDVMCSSTCLTGFHSRYGETDYRFPCAPDAKTKKTSKPNTKTLPLKLIVTAKKTEIPKAYNAESNLEIFPPEGKQTENHIVLVAVVSGLILVGVIVASVCVVRGSLRSRSTQPSDTNKNVHLDPSSMTKLLQSGSTLSNDRDLEMDGPRDRPTVRGELPLHVVIRENDPPFSEKDVTTNNTNDKFIHLERPTQNTMFTKTICHCTKETCEMCFKEYNDIIVDIDIISMIAYNVCHHPEDMFHELEILDSVLYGKSDDRDRNVENISAAEYITQVLLHWTHSNQNAPLAKLSKALCNQGFHHINDLLYTNYCKTCPDPKMHILTHITCTCSITENCKTCHTEFSKNTLDDEFCDIITNNLCHRPIRLFIDIGIPSNVICAKNCGSRKDRHVLASEHQKTLFRTWVKDETIKPKVTLTEVAKKLCKHGYHHINDKLYQHYCKLYPPTIVTIPEHIDIQNSETFEYLPSSSM